MRLFRSGIFVLLLFLVLLPIEAFAEGLRAIVIPFDTHSNVDISSTRRAVMDEIASSLSASGVDIAGIDIIKEAVLKEGVKTFDEKTAFGLGQKVKADFAVLGSITRLGDSFTVDFRVVDLRKREPIAFLFKAATGEDALLKEISSAAPSMREKMVSSLRERPAAKTGIVDSIIVTGNKRVDTEAILKKITSKTGEAFNPDDVREDIRAIYSTGYFDDVSADLSDTASGKVLTFTVREMPFVKKIVIKGNSEIKEEKIRGALTLKENTALDRVSLGENAEKIKKLYSEEGYYLATVKPVIESDGVEAEVRFEIDEGPEVKVKRITFIGNTRFSDGKLKGLMNTQEKGAFSFVTGSGKFNEFIFENDLAILVNKYYDNGYITADILDHRVLLSEDKRWFYITIAINEGEQYTVGKLDMAGDLLFPKEELLDKLKLKTGDIFNRSRMSKGIESITEAYGDKGYAYAEIRPQTRTNPDTKTVDINISVKKNELVYIEKIDIAGNVRTRDKVVRREIEVSEGELYNASALKRSRSNLRRLGYFEDVRVSQAQGSTNEKMKLNVDIKERPTGSISLGIGYSSADKLIGTASISQSNFMGTGIKLDISGTVSSTSSRYVIGFTEPWLFDKPLSAGFDIYDTEKEYADFNIHRKGFDVRFGFPVYDRYTKGYLTYKLEKVDINDVSDSASDFIKEQAGTSIESSIKATAKRDTRDDAFFPTEGTVLTASTEFAGGPLGGTSYFIKYEADAVKYFAMPWETTFSIRGSAGYVMSYDGRDVPIYERYYLGGLNSLRGFESRSVSPKDEATGDLIGGSTMLIINTEYLFPLVPDQQSIKGLVFFDVGNSFSGRPDLTDLRYGAGFGIRWFSPIGPLRLELGFNLDKKDDEKSYVWDFAIGSAF